VRIFGAVLLMGSATIANAKPATLTDDEFREATTKLAAGKHRQVVSWGALRLTGTDATSRFAALASTTGTNNNGQVLCGERACRGVYILEEGPGRFWLVSYTDQRWGHTGAFHADDGDATPATWTVLSDTAIEHHQSHNKGTTVVRFAIRDHAVVVLELHDSIRAGDIHEVHAKNGRCTRKCPTLEAEAASGPLEWYMHPIVVGPAANIADLEDPPSPPDE
jgi:hypothetical protein